MKNRVTKIFLGLSILIVSGVTLAADDPFPGRKMFSEVKTIGLTKLRQNLDKITIVDARSQYEFDTIHIKGASNILVSKANFDAEIRALYLKNKKPIVFYCNGHTCFKSYKAARRAIEAGIKDVYAFDAGIFEWARAYPDQAILLGRSPVQSSALIKKDEFKKRLLEPSDFERRINHKNVLVLDVRSRLQRGGAGLFPFNEKNASLDNNEKLNRLIRKARRENKTILAYDAVGKQVRWFEYYLRERGVRNYYFMKGGADNYYNLLAKQQNGHLGRIDLVKLGIK